MTIYVKLKNCDETLAFADCDYRIWGEVLDIKADKQVASFSFDDVSSFWITDEESHRTHMVKGNPLLTRPVLQKKAGPRRKEERAHALPR